MTPNRHAYKSPVVAQTASLILTAGLLSFVHVRVQRPVMLMAERFLPGIGGWLEIVLLSAYAWWLTGLMIRSKRTDGIRTRIWLLFSVVFFGQFLLGIAGFEIFLMTGKLHIPVPALIIAGPVYRGYGFFMPILYLSTILLVGPTWCSHLCYIGAWDNASARKLKFPARFPKYAQHIRVGILVAVVLVAVALRLMGISSLVASVLGITFGLVGVFLMLVVSRRKGYMAHCTMYCPIGLVSVILGKINPFRIRIADGCTECFVCVPSCRYGALDKDHVRNRKPGMNCTLCGDCVGVCPHRVIEYRFGWLRGEKARRLFIVMAVSLHAVFLGFARI